MSYRFELSPDQQKEFETWQEENDQRLVTSGASLHAGAIGGRFTFSFTNTSLGTVVKVSDDLAKNELDLSDYESW
jgi:hypothetical protein